MPLMVNPSSGTPLYGQIPSIFTYVASATSPSVSQATSGLDIATAAATASAASPLSTGVNMTQVMADEAAQQAGMDSESAALSNANGEVFADEMTRKGTTPSYLMLAFAMILVFCMLISHPRFLARLFASMPLRKHPSSPRKISAYPSDPTSPSAVAHKMTLRVVGGGGLFEGWILRKGDQRLGLSSAHEKADPFASPFDDISLHTPTHPGPHLYPPPHIVPLLTYLPSSSTLLVAPFSRLPNPFRSSAAFVQLSLIVVYLILIAVALVWRSDITPTTKEKGYGSDFGRSGLVAITQIPLVIALGVRGNVIGLCVGKGYERLKVFHKVVGRVFFLSSFLHGAFYSELLSIPRQELNRDLVHKWVIAGMFGKYSSKHFIICGYLAWVAVVLIVVTSLPFIRKAWYGVFEVRNHLSSSMPRSSNPLGLPLCRNGQSACRSLLSCTSSCTVLVS